MMSSKNKAILSFIAVFLVGIAVGVLFENLVLDKKQQNRKRQDPNKFLFEKFTNELSLSTEQQDSLQVLLDDIKEKHRELGKKRHENYERIRSEFDVEFRKILSPDQLLRYDEIIREFEEKMQQRRNKNHDDRDKNGEGKKPEKE
jgi:hypothetical protein